MSLGFEICVEVVHIKPFSSQQEGFILTFSSQRQILLFHVLYAVTTRQIVEGSMRNMSCLWKLTSGRVSEPSRPGSKALY